MKSNKKSIINGTVVRRLGVSFRNCTDRRQWRWQVNALPAHPRRAVFEGAGHDRAHEDAPEIRGQGGRLHEGRLVGHWRPRTVPLTDAVIRAKRWRALSVLRRERTLVVYQLAVLAELRARDERTEHKDRSVRDQVRPASKGGQGGGSGSRREGGNVAVLCFGKERETNTRGVRPVRSRTEAHRK